jgi:hAT family C-terminal dimerisation region
MRKHFKRFTSNHDKALEQFLDFRGRSDCFGEASGLWELTGKPVLFWRYLQASAPELSLFARKVLTVIANSVPLERAFSSMNYIRSKTRNRLDLVCADKLQFLHMNIRALSKQAYLKPSEEDLLAWEDEYLQY